MTRGAPVAVTTADGQATSAAPTDARDRIVRLGRTVVRGIWFFPALLTVLLTLLTVLQVSGSSMGIYQSMLYGAQPDANLLLNEPQPIRSDEWIVNTQLTIAQDAAGYPRINPNIGQGADVSLIVDVPYKEWSAVFKPHNLAFLVLPLDYAFAFKWWLMAVLLILSGYFFVLALMPGRYGLAAGLSLALFFSPFVQWWYQYITLGTLYYALFLATVFILLLRSTRLLATVAWAVLLAYLLTCFALVIYPPFQIPCALALGVFCLGHLVERYGVPRHRPLLRQMGIVAASLVVAGTLVGVFVATRLDTINAVLNTAYPGQRLTQSGGFDLAHLFSGHTSLGLESSRSAAQYSLPEKGLTNQSENSNFLLIFPYLTAPCVYLLYRMHRTRRTVDWPLLLVNLAFLGALAWLFVPHLDVVGKLLFLERVPHTRLLIGIGLLNFFGLVLFVRRLHDQRSVLPGHRLILGYTLALLLVQTLLSLHVVRAFPGFLGLDGFLLSVIPVPLVAYLALRQRFTWAASVLLAFSAAMTASIHPLYRGTETLTQTPLSQAIRAITADDPGAAWAAEVGIVQNFAYMNGAPSLSGVYTYPQPDLWRTADGQGQQEFVFNRYAQVWFTFDRNPALMSPTTFTLTAADHFRVNTEPCGPFLRQHRVKYLVTGTEINESCLKLRDTVSYPAATFLIYEFW
ncbi:DUF7657 domain-containing protein [Micromonospora sp. ZYX-F-536]|uniref:DUF7657 domain-containing protein n=1 Tax=Micromonospora sp. ZYX-F-536 TaxID=3457629 RepID=UPI004040A8E3